MNGCNRESSTSWAIGHFGSRQSPVSWVPFLYWGIRMSRNISSTMECFEALLPFLVYPYWLPFKTCLPPSTNSHTVPRCRHWHVHLCLPSSTCRSRLRERTIGSIHDHLTYLEWELDDHYCFIQEFPGAGCIGRHIWWGLGCSGKSGLIGWG